MFELFYFLLFSLVTQSLQVDPGESQQKSYRLPNNSIPLRYELHLKVDVDKKDFSFNGEVKIHIKAIKATPFVTLNYRQIKIKNINLLNSDGSVNQSNLEYKLREKFEFLKITLPRQLKMHEKVILGISYDGILGTNHKGFYRDSYEKVTVTEKERKIKEFWFATTQFKGTNARQAMPCFDEPGIRAVFDLEIQHDKSYNAISNMPIKRRHIVEGTNYVTSKFQQTPSISTFSLAFLISNLKYKSNNDSRLEQRVYANKYKIESGAADFASSVVQSIIEQCEGHFNLSYPLPKIDHLVVTIEEKESAQSIGLITYSEFKLLRSAFTIFIETKEIVEYIATETASQYFGSIVVPKWWSYAWLNDGFARFYGSLIADLIEPEEEYLDDHLTTTRASAFDYDSEKNVPALNEYVESPVDIEKNCDSLAFTKAECVVRMFYESLTSQTFNKGVTYYLKDMFFKTATPEDFHRNLQRAYDEDFPAKKLNIGEMMKTWEDQAGHPTVNVEKKGENMVLTQTRFGGGDEIYAIPLCYATRSDPDFKTKTVKMWMTTRTIQIPARWMVLDMHNVGYYQVEYGASAIKAIFNGFLKDAKIIPDNFKEKFLNTIMKSILDDTISSVQGLELISYMEQEKQFVVWKNAQDFLVNAYKELFGTETRKNYRKFLCSVLQTHLNRLGLKDIKGESLDDKNLRIFMLGFIPILCWSSETIQLFGGLDYEKCNKMKDVTEAKQLIEMQQLFESNKDNHTKIESAYYFGCSESRVVIEKLLQETLNLTNIMNYYIRGDIVLKTAGKSAVSLETVLSFLEQHSSEFLTITFMRGGSLL